MGSRGGGRELEEKEAPKSINENEQMENWMSDEGETLEQGTW